MSTFLLAFIVSDFDFVSNLETVASGGTIHRIYARFDIIQRTVQALMNSERFLKELERYVDFFYELPKMYSAAIPDFGGGKLLFRVFIQKTIIFFTKQMQRKTGV